MLLLVLCRSMVFNVHIEIHWSSVTSELGPSGVRPWLNLTLNDIPTWIQILIRLK
jgi:hypothetical protein